jgi:hypothetical protein
MQRRIARARVADRSPQIWRRAADVVAKAQAVLSESELLRAMFDVGYFPPNTPPDRCAIVDNEHHFIPPL